MLVCSFYFLQATVRLEQIGSPKREEDQGRKPARGRGTPIGRAVQRTGTTNFVESFSDIPFSLLNTFISQVEKLNSRLRAAERTADEAEEETTRVNGLKRKLQRDLDEANEQIESLQREIQAQRNKAR